MARVAYGRRTTRVSTSSYPDDGTSPVGTNEWNSDPESSGLFGFTKVAATLDGNGVLSTKDDSATFTNEGGSSQAKQSTLIEIECNASSTTDAVEKIDITDTNENDIVYLFKGTNGDTVTVTHTGSLSSNGQIQSLDGSAITVNDTGKPVCLMRRGNYWFEFGGGGATATEITVADTTDTSCSVALFESATGDLPPKSDAGLTYNAGTGTLTATAFTGPLTGNVTGNASGSSATCSGLAATATALANARTIGGTSFDGTANIAVALSATATALATARTIGGVSFDGTANINLPGVNASGNQNTSGTAAVATAVTITDNENTNESNAIIFTAGGDVDGGNLGLESDGDLTYNPSSGLLSATGLTLSGDLTVSGTTTTLDVSTLAVEDPLIQLAKSNSAADTLDIGFWGLYDTSGSQDLYAGLFRDANDSGKWKLFKDNQAAPTTTVNTSGTGYAVATLVANLEGAVTGNVTGNASGSSGSWTGNAATVTTNANLTGEVTSSGNATTIASNIVDEDNLKISNSGSNGEFLSKQSGNTGGLTWASAGGGATLFHVYSNSTTTSYAGQSGEAQTLGTAVGTLASGSGDRDIYIRKVDTNNEGVFAVIHKNGSLVEVQVA